jgi:hypothetical protein
LPCSLGVDRLPAVRTASVVMVMDYLDGGSSTYLWNVGLLQQEGGWFRWGLEYSGGITFIVTLYCAHRLELRNVP